MVGKMLIYVLTGSEACFHSYDPHKKYNSALSWQQPSRCSMSGPGTDHYSEVPQNHSKEDINIDHLLTMLT